MGFLPIGIILIWAPAVNSDCLFILEAMVLLLLGFALGKNGRSTNGGSSKSPRAE